mmetsp:Transcript_135472/g.235019  ORF Transcript_135472/g.235019 Transcript_135472/m.235019 type:complete len:257 (+) Transcript_135472:3333-4103(+)
MHLHLGPRPTPFSLQPVSAALQKQSFFSRSSFRSSVSCSTLCWSICFCNFSCSIFCCSSFCFSFCACFLICCNFVCSSCCSALCCSSIPCTRSCSVLCSCNLWLSLSSSAFCRCNFCCSAGCSTFFFPGPSGPTLPLTNRSRISLFSCSRVWTWKRVTLSCSSNAAASAVALIFVSSNACCDCLSSSNSCCVVLRLQVSSRNLARSFSVLRRAAFTAAYSAGEGRSANSLSAFLYFCCKDLNSEGLPPSSGTLATF